LGDLKLLEIRPLHIQNFIKDMTKTGLANSTINHFKKTIGAVFNYMIDSGVIYQNPVNRIKCLKVKNNTLMRPLTIKETNKLLTVTKKHYPDFYPVLYIAVNTGLREGELFALTWDCVNFVEGYIVVNKSYTHGVLGSTKTGKERKVKISLTVTKFLKEWKMACPKSELNLVFPNANGNYMDSQNMMKRRFKPALALAGIDNIRFHDLRHTYASTLIIQQVPLPYISKQLGHSTNKVTLDTYVHLMPESAQLGDSLLENLYEDRDTGLEESNVRRFGT
jgi:integrase